MTLDAYNTFCASLPHATHVVQWGGAHVWKVGGKVFAIAGEQDTHHAETAPVSANRKVRALHVTFKVSPLAYDMLKDEPGLRPAPYLASRGMTWIQHMNQTSMKDAALKKYLKESHRLVALGLPKKMQHSLSLLPS